MKTLTLTLCLLFGSIGYSQKSSSRQKINLNLPQTMYHNNNQKVNIGPSMMLGGAGLFAAGILTPPIMVGGSTTEKLPFYKQGGRAFAMVAGGLVFTFGVGISIHNKK